MRHDKPRLLSALAAGLALLAWSGASRAQSDTVDTDPGKALALRWCAECHDITGAYSELMGIRNYGDPPSFYAVANDLAVTETALRAFLRTPHARMPEHHPEGGGNGSHRRLHPVAAPPMRHRHGGRQASENGTPIERSS